jgi:hypothetical protein
MSHPASGQPQKDAHIGPVRGDTVASHWEALCAKLAHALYENDGMRMNPPIFLLELAGDEEAAGLAPSL